MEKLKNNWKTSLPKEKIRSLKLREASNGLDWSNISSIWAKNILIQFIFFLPWNFSIVHLETIEFPLFWLKTMKQYKRHIDANCIVKARITSMHLFCLRPSGCSQPLKQKGIEAVWPLTNRKWRDIRCCSGPLFIFQWLKPASHFPQTTVQQWQWQRAAVVKLIRVLFHFGFSWMNTIQFLFFSSGHCLCWKLKFVIH